MHADVIVWNGITFVVIDPIFIYVNEPVELLGDSFEELKAGDMPSFHVDKCSSSGVSGPLQPKD